MRHWTCKWNCRDGILLFQHKKLTSTQCLLAKFIQREFVINQQKQKQTYAYNNTNLQLGECNIYDDLVLWK